MVAAFGGSDAEGRWTQRDSFEVLEHAVALHLRAARQEISSTTDIAPMIDLASRFPTQTVRSEDQLEWQQFSTPVDISAVAVFLANIQVDDIILEPRAGNGLLVAQIGAHHLLYLNELDPTRRAPIYFRSRYSASLNACGLISCEGLNISAVVPESVAKRHLVDRDNTTIAKRLAFLQRQAGGA